jgi:hypothetical protein
LLEERYYVALYVGFKLEYIFLRKYGRDDFTLARMRDTIKGSERATRDGDKRVVIVAFKRAIPMCVDYLQCVGVRDG